MGLYLPIYFKPTPPPNQLTFSLQLTLEQSLERSVEQNLYLLPCDVTNKKQTGPSFFFRCSVYFYTLLLFSVTSSLYLPYDLTFLNPLTQPAVNSVHLLPATVLRKTPSLLRFVTNPTGSTTSPNTTEG